MLDLLPDDALPPGSGQPSADCTPPTVDVIDSPVAAGYARLRVKQKRDELDLGLVRAAMGGSSFGGKLVIEPPAPGGGGTPSTDTNSAACGSTPGNQAPGPHPIADPGTVAGQHVLVDTWSTNSETWVCVELGSSVTSRIKLAVPGVTLGSIRFERDA